MGRRMCDHASTERIATAAGRPARFIVPGVLLLLAEEATYGYELGIKMAALGFIENENDTALIYRALANLSKGGFVLLRETPGDGGPPRKVYSLTPGGRELLRDWQNVIEGRVAMLSRFLHRCAKLDIDQKGERHEGFQHH